MVDAQGKAKAVSRPGVLAEWLTKQDAERQSVPEKPSWHCPVPCVMVSVISVPCPGVLGLKGTLRWNTSLCAAEAVESTGEYQEELWRIIQ